MAEFPVPSPQSSVPIKLGSPSIVTDHTGAAARDMLFYPWGQVRQQWGSNYDTHFAAFQQREFFSGLDPTPARMYHSRLFRWMTPDPVGGDITNPQSLNRYAYVLNNPATLTDPQGLQSDDCAPDSPDFHESWCQAQYAYMSNLALESYDLEAAFGLGFSYDYNSQSSWPFSWYQFSGDLYGHRYDLPLGTTLDQYAEWVTDLAALPASQVYSVLSNSLENWDPNHAYDVDVFWRGLLPNVRIAGVPLSATKPAQSGINDPYKGTHPKGSYFSLSPLDTTHCAAGDFGAECHNDLFHGIFLLPLHELFDYLPSLFINPKSQVPQSTTWYCTLNGGCRQ